MMVEPIRVLIVDDQPRARKSVRALLSTWQRVRVPVMLLIGERSVIYDPQRVYRRARRLIPDIQAEIIPDASHALIAEKSDLVNARILEFLTDKQ